MLIETNIIQDSLNAKLDGQFTFSDNSDFKEKIVNIVDNGSFNSVVLDLSKLEFLDSAALGMLLILKDSAEQKGATISLSNACGNVAKMLYTANFDKLFNMYWLLIRFVIDYIASNHLEYIYGK